MLSEVEEYVREKGEEGVHAQEYRKVMSVIN